MTRKSSPVLVLLLCGCAQSSPRANEEKAGSPPSASPQAPSPDAEEPSATQPAAAATPGAPTAAQAAPTEAEIGQPAPDFELADLQGKTHSLSDHAGKTVVLEWFNPGCPFVNYAHTEGPLKEMAGKQLEQGVVWLAINSGAPGKQGAAKEENEASVAALGMKHPVLLDPSGAIGHAYGAEKTPHLFLIDAEGVLRYRGAIDNAPFGEVDGGSDVRNHLAEALAELRAGKPISTPETPAYGCTVKYAKAH